MAIVQIEPDDEVYRRLAPDTVDRRNNVVRRNAFYTHGEPDPEISVHLRRLAGTPEESLDRAGRPNFGLGLVRASDVLELGLEIEHRPTADDASHTVILGVKTKADCDKLAEITMIVKAPELNHPG